MVDPINHERGRLHLIEICGRVSLPADIDLPRVFMTFLEEAKAKLPICYIHFQLAYFSNQKNKKQKLETFLFFFYLSVIL